MGKKGREQKGRKGEGKEEKVEIPVLGASVK